MTFPRNSIYILTAYFCLFLSGAASLVYELVWIKQLTLVFGGTLYAISAVLCAFMTGLALGAWGISRYLETRKTINLIRLYGIVEGAIGIYGLLFPWGLKVLSLIYPAIIGVSIDSSPHFAEFILSALLMLPATFLMGATLPLIGSWAIGDRPTKLFSRISILYSINTFGAVLGCLFAQFFGIERFGISGITWLAVALNTLVFLLSRQLPVEATEAPITQKPTKPPAVTDTAPEPSRSLSVLLLAIFTFSGFASLASEILWTRALVFPLGSTLYSFALILATFLFGIALGSLVAEKILGNSGGAFKFLAIELAIGIFCIAMIPAFDLLPELTSKADRLFYDVQNTPLRTLLVRSIFAFGLMFLPTLGFGIIFPLANRIHISLFNTVSGTLGNTYAVNTVGAVLGTLVTPFILIPLLGIRGSLFAIYSTLILLACAGLALHKGRGKPPLATSLAFGGILIFGGHVWSTPEINTLKLGQGNFARMEIDVPPERIRLLDYKEGDFATLSAVEHVDTGARTLYVNGFSTATVSDSVGGSSYMQAMGFVPMALHPDPRKALVICFGTGNTLGTVSLFPGVTVDGVEIDRNVLSFAHWFSQWNHDVLQRPNTHMTIQDGRGFIRWTDKTYDIITLEPMSPVHAGVTNLYSKEFYQLSSRRLTPNGIMMQWLPLHLVSPADARSIIKTFQEVFPHTSVWNSFLTRIVLLVGSNQPVTLDKTRFDALMTNPELRRTAEQMGVFSFLDFMDFYLADGRRISPLLQGSNSITDDRPTLEYSSAALLPPLKWETDESFLNILRHRVGYTPPLSGVSEKSELEDAFRLRTAQRWAVFSRRYHGPGEQNFATQNHLAGLSEVKDYLEKNKASLISLRDQRWQEKPDKAE